VRGWVDAGSESDGATKGAGDGDGSESDYREYDNDLIVQKIVLDLEREFPDGGDEAMGREREEGAAAADPADEIDDCDKAKDDAGRRRPRRVGLDELRRLANAELIFDQFRQ